MARKQFDIKSLLLLTAVSCCLLRFLTLEGSFVFRFFVTMLFTTFLAAVLALIWFVVVPMFGGSRD